MEGTLNALGGILLNAVPTLLLILLLHFYLKAVFFKPLEKVLSERENATLGARRKAEQLLAQAEAKAAEYEQKLSGARNEIYREQEELRRQLKAEQEKQLAEAAAQAKRQVDEARAQIAAEVEAGRRALQEESRMLASEIAGYLLGRPN